MEEADTKVRQKREDVLGEFYSQLHLAEAMRLKLHSQKRIKEGQVELLHRIEQRLERNEQRLRRDNHQIAESLKQSLEELQVRQAKMEMAFEDRYSHPAPQLQPMFIPYPPPQYAMQAYRPPIYPTKQPQQLRSKKHIISQRNISAAAAQEQEPSKQPVSMKMRSRPPTTEPEQAIGRAIKPSLVRTNIFSRESLKVPTGINEEAKPEAASVEEPKPVPKPRPTTRRIRKYLLAVYYLQLLRSKIRDQIMRRQLKSETTFNNLFRNALNFLCDKIIESCGSVQKTMISHEKEKPEYLNSEECYKEVEGIVGVIVERLLQLKDILLKDRALRSLLKMLTRQNEFIPSNYLTLYELQRLNFSVSFGFIYRTEEICCFLVGMFLLIRGVVMGVCNNPLRLDPLFFRNEVVKGMLALVADAFYHLALSVLETFWKQQDGNWKEVRKEVKYIPAATMCMDGAKPSELEIVCVAGDWKQDLLSFIKKRQFWPSSQVRLRTFLRDVCSVLAEHTRSEDMSMASRASKRSQRSLK